MRVIPRGIPSALRLVGAWICLVVLASCAVPPRPFWYDDIARRPPLPSEVSFNTDAGRGGNFFLRVRSEEGADLLFGVDTGSSVTVLDKTLQPKLGKRVGTGKFYYPYYRRTQAVGVYRAPELSLGGTRLLTSRWVVVDDLSQIAGGMPVRGILGIDCLRHYCVQLDFAASKMRFLDPDKAKSADLGKSFPLSFSRWTGQVTLNQNFAGVKGAKSVLDTGDFTDGALEAKLFQQWTNKYRTTQRRLPREAASPDGVFGGEVYPDLMLKPHSQNTIGLRFLARHVVTFNFPKGTIFLKRQTVGPLLEQGPTSFHEETKDAPWKSERTWQTGLEFGHLGSGSQGWRCGIRASLSAKGAHHTSPAQRAGYSVGQCQSAESAFHWLGN